jgi:hypothetical protein
MSVCSLTNFFGKTSDRQSTRNDSLYQNWALYPGS